MRRISTGVGGLRDTGGQLCCMLVGAVCVLGVALNWNVHGEERPWEAPDLMPVQTRTVEQHDPIVLIASNRAPATLVAYGLEGVRDRELREALAWLESCLEAASGVAVSVRYPFSGRLSEIEGPAVVIGNSPELASISLSGESMPAEGFMIRTAPDRVYIVGHDATINKENSAYSFGTVWGITEFLERFVGVRWYYPGDAGRDVPRVSTILVPPTCIASFPQSRRRKAWRQSIAFLREGNSWPVSVRVHASSWGSGRAYRESLPEVFELLEDGERNYGMPCFGSEASIAVLLEMVAREMAGGSTPLDVRGHVLTISPPDAPIRCHCEHCRPFWDHKAGRFGTASPIMTRFVNRVAAEALTRWPELKIIYLPYANYTDVPAGLTFPPNVQVQLCGMPGLARYSDPQILAREEANIAGWFKASGQPLQMWHYSCWPAIFTRACFQYPHVIRRHYESNRGRIIGTFINGPDYGGGQYRQDYWPRFHLTLYCWMKLLWEPSFDVDAAIDVYCERMFGPGAESMRTLINLQIEGWESVRWPDVRFTREALYATGYTPKRISRIKGLLADARQRIGDSAPYADRFRYVAAPFAAFFAEADAAHATD